MLSQTKRAVVYDTALTNVLEHSWELRFYEANIWRPRFINLHVYVCVCQEIYFLLQFCAGYCNSWYITD